MKKLILLLATLLLIAPVASAEEPQARPGVIRQGDKCFQPTDTYGDFRDTGREIPCDDRYKEGEKIAEWEFLLKTNLKMENSPGHVADWEAWQASAASGATTWIGRFDAFIAELQKQGAQHPDAAKPFLHGRCQPNEQSEQTSKEALLRGCKHDEAMFQRDYWLALQGDHKAQEHVAWCSQDDTRATMLATKWPCHRVVEANETMMCAWYLVAASSGHPESSHSAEQYGYVYECDKKPMYVRQAILGTASELFLRIYHRPLPVAQ